MKIIDKIKWILFGRHKYIKNQKRLDAFGGQYPQTGRYKAKDLVFSAMAHCPCGAGLAYPKKDATTRAYWDCSAILMGVADKSKKHEAQLPFVFYDIPTESSYRGTTRPGAGIQGNPAPEKEEK